MALEPGRSGVAELIVADDDTAEALHSGDVPVLGTPRVVTLCEEATLAAVKGELEPGQTTVGTRVELAHLLPVPVGRTVRADACLEKIDGRRLVFTVSVKCDDAVVAAGRITRALVDRGRFMEKAAG